MMLSHSHKNKINIVQNPLMSVTINEKHVLDKLSILWIAVNEFAYNKAERNEKSDFVAQLKPLNL